MKSRSWFLNDPLPQKLQVASLQPHASCFGEKGGLPEISGKHSKAFLNEKCPWCILYIDSLLATHELCIGRPNGTSRTSKRNVPDVQTERPIDKRDEKGETSWQSCFK